MKQKKQKSSFLVKPLPKGRPYPCYERGFDTATEDCQRVARLEDMRLGIEEHTEDVFFELKANQPVFYLQERYTAVGMSREGGGLLVDIEWNGLLLFHCLGKEEVRRLVKVYREEWHIVLAYDDPDSDCYSIVVDTMAEDFSHDSFLKFQSMWKSRLDLILGQANGVGLEFYERVYTSSHYDIVDREALFGQAAEKGGESAGPLSKVEMILKNIFKRREGRIKN